MRHRSDRRRGVTLLELVVVLGIISILAAIAIPLFSGNKDRAIWGQAKANLDAVRSALAVYNANSPGDVFPGVPTTDYLVLRGLLPDANLPPNPREAGWRSSDLHFSISGSAKWYTLTVKVDNTFGDIIVGTPSGAAPSQYPR
jgi:prepilin-type N-terminal cleavage/methylation domain-containing protein